MAAVSIENEVPKPPAMSRLGSSSFADNGIKSYGVVYVQDREMAASSGCPREKSACLTL